MKLRLFFIFGWLFALVGISLSAAQPQNPTQGYPAAPIGPKIRVLLEKDISSALLEAKGAYRVVRKDNNAILSSGYLGKRFVIHALQNGLRWGEEYPDIYQIAVVPLTRETSIYVNGIQYKGAVSIYHMRNNHIAIINEVPIEDYLKSTLAVQYEQKLPKEALSALAIAARTQAYNIALQGQTITRPWDITAQEACYFGFGVTQQKNGVEESIDWTRFMVLESVKPDGNVKDLKLAPSRADELAKKGFDTQKILKTAFPHAKIGVTISADEVAVR